MEIQGIIERKYIQEVPASKFEEIHRLECTEVLDNLGYIGLDKDKSAEPQELSTEEVITGIKKFRAEFHLNKKDFQEDYVLPEYRQNMSLSEEELDFFEDLCSLEGGFALHKYSADTIKNNPILVRVLNYRLQILNLSDKNVSPEYNKNTESILQKVGTWCASETIEQTLSAIGNIELLYSKIITQKQFHNSKFQHLIYFTNKVDTKAEKQFKFNNKPERFEERLSSYPIEIVADYKKTRNSKKEFTKKVSDDLNQLMIRITQIRLWLIGIYNGRLDSNLGVLSLNALKDSLSLYRSIYGNTKGFAANDLIVYLKKDRWAINSVFFDSYLNLLSKHDDNGVQTINQEIENLYHELANEEKEGFIVEFNALLEGGNNARQKSKSYRKTKSRGIKSLYKTVSNFIKKLITGIKQGLQKVMYKLKLLFNLVKNGISIVYRELKKVYNLLKAGLAFFFGKREILSENSGASIHTNFDFNFDSTTICKNSNENLLLEQLAKCDAQINALKDVSTFLGKAVNICLKIGSGPLGWLKLGLELIRWLANNAFSYNRFSFE